jgi:hypothetical protein
VGLELADDSEMLWEMDYHRDLASVGEAQFHDFYSEEYAICMYPPSLDPDNHHIHKQCMISLWLNGKRDLDFSGSGMKGRRFTEVEIVDESLIS